MKPDLLAQLHDIHSTPPVSWWPPAAGWWLLALLLLALLTWGVAQLLARYKAHLRRRRMLVWVDHLNATIDPQHDPQPYLATLNRVFKLVALRAFPGQHCEVMSGRQWAQFISARLKPSGSAEPLLALASGPYEPAPQFDPARVSELARRWIRQYG